MIADLHAHTQFSFDGDATATPQQMAEAAIARGLTHLALTDHCDIDCELAGIYPPLDKDAAFTAISALKEQYRGRLEILVGIELGQAHHCPEAARALLARYPYDLVLGSLHNLANERDFYFFEFDKLTDAQTHAYFDRVLEESVALCDFDGIHVITHLTYMDRYLHRAGKALDLTPHLPALSALLDKIVAKGLTLELNTSCLGEGYGMPTEELLALYHSRGGRRVCLGSDAHKPQRIAQHFDKALAILRRVGFTDLTLPTRDKIITYPIPEEKHE